MDAREHLPYETIRVCTRFVGYVFDEYIREIEFLLPAPRCSLEGSLSLEKSDTLDTICTYEIGYPMKATYRSGCAHLLTTDKNVTF